MSSANPSPNKMGGDAGAQLPELADKEVDPALALTPMKGVIELPELLELILDFAVHDEDRYKRNKTLGAVRLVSKKWLTAVTKLMLRIKEPLYRLRLNSIPSDSETGEGVFQSFEEFATLIENRIEEPFPAFSLELSMENKLSQETYDSLKKCLIQFGQGLVLLKIFINVSDEYGLSLFEVVPSLHLPNLRTFHVIFVNYGGAEVFEFPFEKSKNVLSFLQSILDGATSLKEFSLPDIGSDSENYFLPRGIEQLSLPQSITDLEVEIKMRSKDCELLLNNKFPYLAHFSLAMDTEPVTSGVFYKVLQNVSNNLRKLIMPRISWYLTPFEQNYRKSLLRFPVMKNLKELEIGAEHFELEDNHLSLKNSFPELKELVVWNQTRETLRKWTNTPLDSVTGFSFSLVDHNKSESDPDYTLPLELETMQSFQLAFSNLTELGFKLPGSGANSLKHVFATLRQLKYLDISVDENELFANSDLWDSAFTGAPVSVVQQLRENPELADCVELRNNLVSIRMLTELQTLCLSTTRFYPRSLNNQSLISDVTFEFALLEMDNLNALYLRGGFRPSDQMIQEWEQLDGRISYSAGDN